jgi:hypothetical protein
MNYGEQAMIESAVAALIMVFTIFAGYAAEKPRQFSCTGSMIEPTSLAPSPKNVKLTFGSAQNVGVDLGQGNSNARVLSNNKIQIKFRMKDFVGEFFHYTGDLFLIITRDISHG